MASTVFDSILLKAKFRGCLIGVLVGDCLGVPFEFEGYVVNDSVKIILPSKQRLGGFMTNLVNGGIFHTLFHLLNYLFPLDYFYDPFKSTKKFRYTDDTCMTLNVVESLVDQGEVNAKDMAESRLGTLQVSRLIVSGVDAGFYSWGPFCEKFVKAYFTQDRGYGRHVRNVFRKLRESQFEDVFLPAKEQFDGQGSFGNGAAMRISPIALFGYSKSEEYIMNAAKECSLITHYHPNAYRGAILQCFAVNAALKLDPSQEFDPVDFIDVLLKKMEQIETEKIKPYCESLEKMKEIFVQNHEEDVTSEEIAQSLGNGDDVSALKSVPTAIFSFLRGMKPLTDQYAPRFVPAVVYSLLTGKEKSYFESDNPFMRTIYFAISVGGDSDTIASMAGAIAGAYYGEDIIPDSVQEKCEAVGEIIALADKLFDVTYKND